MAMQDDLPHKDPGAPVAARRVCDDADLTITHYAGETDTAVVAFTGIGHGMGAVQRDEFVGTALGRDANHVISVIDRDRSWYSAPKIKRRIAGAIRDLRASLGLRRLICLGNSMGGFGALLFAERIGADTAIAFVPQYSMRADFGERRWAEFRPQMVEDGLVTLGEALTGRTRAFVVFGGADSRDRLHCTRIRRNCIARVHVLAGTGHDVTLFLKKQGLLAPLIGAMVDGDQQKVADILAPFDETRTAVR
ncbi:MAG: alpha/beta fold hydrolase [Marinibacterium sp.]